MSNLNDVMVVGLTGQTGAGKSTVSRTFYENGFAIINADLVARKVVEKGMKCLDEIHELFGDSVINDDGTLNRKMLANIVFSDSGKLEMLNTITYPYITGEILNEIKVHSLKGEKLILLDAPTLFESRADDFCELIISIVADEQVREKRIIVRDGLTKEQARKRMNSQLSEDFFKKNSDYIINNDDTIEKLEEISKEVSDKIKEYYINKINPAVESAC